ncbi:MAG: single-stranded-DNA-specific exonuclease RecJ [Candidatus Magasanikbacteria bacterium]
MSEKIWELKDEPPQEFYDEHPELPEVVARLLYHRGIRSQEEIDEFLNPDYSEDIHDPFLFGEMETAVERIFSAIDEDESIMIFGDYDADGVSAAAILDETLEALGAENLDVYLPNRETEGYGLNKGAIEVFADDNVDLIITCDCGISDKEEVEVANEHDMDVIITDHHSIPEQTPDSFATLHPKIEEENYPDQTLSGGAVAFKLAQGLLRKDKQQDDRLESEHSHEGFEKWLLDLVAIANVADMVPLKGEARTLTKHGFIVLNKTKRIGLQKLLLEASIMEEDGNMKQEIDSGTIAFQIAPRINAAGRINHANVAYRLMVTDDEIEAIDLADELNQNNRDRQQMVKENMQEVERQIEEQQDQPLLFVRGEGWKKGLTGLIASKIKEKHHKPTIAVTYKSGEYTGSGRSIEGFNIVEALQDMDHYFSTFGGHPMACGFTLSENDTLEDFKEDLIDKFKQETDKEDLKKKIVIDSKIKMKHVDWELYDILQQFKPFGKGNRKPKYLAEELEVQSVKPVGSNNNHLTFMATHEKRKMHKFIGWNLCADSRDLNWADELSKGDKVDVVFDISVNEWNGNRELQFTIEDIRKA